jgi:hypothetical protein
MNGYTIIIIALLAIIVASIYDLEPAIKQLVYTIADLPKIDAKHVKEPAIFSVAVRAMYLITLVGIIKLLVWRNKDDE